MPLRGAGRALQGGDPYAPHEAGHAAPFNGVPLVPKQIARHPDPGKWRLEIELLDPAHQGRRRLQRKWINRPTAYCRTVPKAAKSCPVRYRVA
jgi:hypothetical protein